MSLALCPLLQSLNEGVLRSTPVRRHLRQRGEPQRTVCSSRASRLRGFPPLCGLAWETLSAIAHGGNPQDRIASPRNCPP
ncbi:hypothetical protein [Nostoc sp. T09]|uniref:hypothetical protein n=1 Tax=Nostoc sp. T09 TaxID=1932621 RepID=UPI0015C4EFCC|nr:hypothetical protein [Nostoc sp. T09]